MLLAQQQNGDPTLPTAVAEPAPSLLEQALKPSVSTALMVATDGLGELAEAGAALAARALELSSAMGKTADYVTLAVTGTKEGTTVVSSSEKALRPAVRALLKPGEVAAKGAGHAEVTGVNAARQMGLTPTGVAASRGICPSWRVAQVRLSRKSVGDRWPRSDPPHKEWVPHVWIFRHGM